MKVLLIQNCSVEGFGFYEVVLRRIASDVKVIHPYRGEPFPGARDFDAVIIGGTPVSAYLWETHPYLREEHSFLKTIIAEDIPCLGICFGAQLLSLILGGTVTNSLRKEIGIYQIELTEFGKNDPCLTGFPARFSVFQWHGDTFFVPPLANLLAVGQTCRNQMFRLGRAVGVQFHLEIDSQEAGSWCDAYAEELKSFGKTKDHISAQFKPAEKQMALLAEKLIHNFLNRNNQDS
jgi:GMP synthase (glutamine-hydrolysing)